MDEAQRKQFELLLERLGQHGVPAEKLKQIAESGVMAVGVREGDQVQFEIDRKLRIVLQASLRLAAQEKAEVKRRPARPPTHLGFRLLKLAAYGLPGIQRADWLEEHRAYLCDLPTRRAKIRWIWKQLLGTPRYVYTVRTGLEKEAA